MASSFLEQLPVAVSELKNVTRITKSHKGSYVRYVVLVIYSQSNLVFVVTFVFFVKSLILTYFVLHRVLIV